MTERVVTLMLAAKSHVKSLLGASLILGMVAAAPSVAQGQEQRATVVRYTTTGALDRTFAGDGTATINLRKAPYNEQAIAVALASQGKIVVAGSASLPAAQQAIMVARFTQDGKLDPTFGGTGQVITNLSSRYEQANAVAVDSSQRVVVAGVADGRFFVARYRSTGVLDTTFGTDGTVVTSFGNYPSHNGAEGIAIARDGKILITGGTGANQFAVARYNTNGTLDSTFGVGGKVVTSLSPWAVASSVAIDGNGKIVVAGTSGDKFAAVRYNANGSLDTSFGFLGLSLIDFASSEIEVVRAMIVDSSNRVIIGGDADGKFALVRTTANGILDTTFDGDGKVLTDFASRSVESILGLAMTFGRIVAVGFAGHDGRVDFAVARYLSTGALDTSFDGDGKVLTPINGFGYAAAADSNGRPIAAGFVYP